MLVRLYGKNFRSLRDAFELSLVAADLTRKEDRDRGVSEVVISGMPEPLRLLRIVAIYGPNASGKSTILTAGRALHWLAAESSLKSRPDEFIPPYEPFQLDRSSSKSPVELGCDVVYKKSILRYEIAFQSKAIQKEVLSILDGNGEDRLIERHGTGKIGGRLIESSKVNPLYVTEMQPNVTVLAKLAQHGPERGNESAKPYYRAVRDATRFEDYSDAALEQIRISDFHDERFADDAGYRDWIMNHLVRAADFGICDVTTRRENFAIPKEVREQIERENAGRKFPDSRIVVSFVHEGEVNRSIDFSRESAGTKKILNIAKDWWALAHEPVTILAEELSASLHPRLLDGLVRAVNEAPTDHMRSQLVFATHDTGLMEGRDGMPPALRRDQIYLTQKDDRGATTINSLTEYKENARGVHNIRKRYLSGLYGAIPLAEKLSL